jgi:hypothetical protein
MIGEVSRSLLAAVAAAVTILASAAPARAGTALELVRIAQAHEQASQDDIAVDRYMDALAIDSTCEEAYLGLGGLRERRGDLREAERVYSVALEHVPSLRLARVARARLRRARGANAAAAEDMLTGAEDDVAALRTLASWYGEDGQAPAQLAVWRRLMARAEATQDASLRREARTMVRALLILVGSADPAAYPPDAAASPHDDRTVRRAMRLVARRAQ